MTRALLLLTLVACSPTPPAGWTFDWRSLPQLDAATTVAAAQDTAPCPAGRDYLRGGTVIWYDGPVQGCGSELLSGCWDWMFEYRVSWRSEIAATSLLDELGHAVWYACYGRIGEDAAHGYDADFAAWVGAARAELERRLGT